MAYRLLSLLKWFFFFFYLKDSVIERRRNICWLMPQMVTRAPNLGVKNLGLSVGLPHVCRHPSSGSWIWNSAASIQTDANMEYWGLACWEFSLAPSFSSLTFACVTSETVYHSILTHHFSLYLLFLPMAPFLVFWPWCSVDIHVIVPFLC